MYFLPTESLLDYNNFVDDLMYKLKAYIRLNKIRKKVKTSITREKQIHTKKVIVSLYNLRIKL